MNSGFLLLLLCTMYLYEAAFWALMIIQLKCQLALKNIKDVLCLKNRIIRDSYIGYISMYAHVYTCTFMQRPKINFGWLQEFES